MSGKVKDITGQRFGHLTAIRFVGTNKWQRAVWEVQCDCGTVKTVGNNELHAGTTISCGCQSSRKKVSYYRHGHYQSPTYKIWKGMLQRCHNDKAPQYFNYGGRGIVVCERWHDFTNFLADMGERPGNLSIDRIDNNGNYEPGNCRWATKTQQCNNTRRNRYVTIYGETKTLMEWARHFGMEYNTLKHRVVNWPEERWLEPQHSRRKGPAIERTGPVPAKPEVAA